MDRASGVWTVRGVGVEHRRSAKSAASAAGVTLGKWIENAIEAGLREGTRGVLPGEKKSPTIREVVEGKEPLVGILGKDGVVRTVEELGPVVDCEVTEDFPPKGSELEAIQQEAGVPPIRAHGRKPRVVCQHGVEKGYNCWQCGGLARVGS